MELDIRTMVAILLLTHIVQVFIFSHQYLRNRNQKDIKYWLLWSICLTMSFLFILLRSYEPLLKILIILQNTFMGAGTVFLYIGSLRYYKTRPNYKIIAASLILLVTVLIIFTCVTNQVFTRSLLVNIFLFIYILLTGLRITLKSSSERGSMQKILGYTFFILCLMLLLRIYMMIGFSFDPSDMLNPHPLNVLSFLILLIVSIIWTFTYIVLINERITSELSESRDRFQLLFDTSPDAISLTRIKDGLIRNANSNFHINFGISENAAGKKTSDYNIWADPAERNKIMAYVEKTGNCNNVEVSFRKGDVVFKGLFSAKKIDFENEPHILSVSRDISEFRNFQAEVAEAGRKWQMTFDALPEAVFILNNEGIVTNLNSSSVLLLGREKQDMIGKHCWELVHESKGHYDNCPFLRMKETKKRESMLFQIGEKWFEVTTDPIFSSKNELTGAVHIMSDITARKKAEDDMKRTAKELKEFNDIMVGREIRMAELKSEINRLLEASGKKAKY